MPEHNQLTVFLRPAIRTNICGKLSFVLMTVLLLLTLFGASRAQEVLPDIPYILVDAADNTVISASRIHERWHPASLTKLMTAYVTFRAIQNGEITIGSPVTITKNAARTPPGKMGYKEGTLLRYDMALYTLIVKSANDVAVALAESLAGNLPAFVSRMNDEARRLGLTNTNFTNPNGLHDSQQYTSARDLVILSSAIWNEFPQYRQMFETPTIQAGTKKYTSYNFLLERFAGTTGMKTGFVCSSGYNIVASAERGGKRLVVVVLGSASQTERAEIAARLFLKGFENSSGQPMASMPAPTTSMGPSDMRPILCTEQARKSRYDPASENAVLKSKYLQPRSITKQPFMIVTGNIDGEASPAWMAREFTPKRVPIPTKRPVYEIVNVDGDVIGSSTLRGTYPLPEKRPASADVDQ
ncbi:MAG: D-alanyl-D-alanine carboxypeptidase family protein [Salaquimonas sp.]